MTRILTILLCVSAPLWLFAQSPREAETFAGVQMFRLDLLNPAKYAVTAAPAVQYAWTLTWKNPPNELVATNRVYHGTNSGEYYEYRDFPATEQCTFVSPGERMMDYFAVTVIDVIGMESDYSNQYPRAPFTAVVLICPIGAPIYHSTDLATVLSEVRSGSFLKYSSGWDVVWMDGRRTHFFACQQKIAIYGQ